MEEFKPEIFNRDGLSALSIFELRGLARSLGVVSPTSKDKEDMVEEILQIVYGENYDILESLTKGRPVKGRRELDWLSAFNAGEEEDIAYKKLDRNFEGSYSFVATNTVEYRNDAEPDYSGKDVGHIVCINYQFYFKTFRSTGDVYFKVSPEFVEENNLNNGEIVRVEIENGKVIRVVDFED